LLRRERFGWRILVGESTYPGFFWCWGLLEGLGFLGRRGHFILFFIGDKRRRYIIKIASQSFTLEISRTLVFEFLQERYSLEVGIFLQVLNCLFSESFYS
jgi:uncharacterized protein (TIGR03382 family)